MVLSSCSHSDAIVAEQLSSCLCARSCLCDSPLHRPHHHHSKRSETHDEFLSIRSLDRHMCFRGVSSRSARNVNSFAFRLVSGADHWHCRLSQLRDLSQRLFFGNIDVILLRSLRSGSARRAANGIDGDVLPFEKDSWPIKRFHDAKIYR